MNIKVIVVCFLSLWMGMVCQSSTDKQYQIYIDSNGHYHFQWSVDYHRQVIQVILTVQISPNSWFAVGFSDYGEVTSADLVAFWTDKQDRHHFVDGHTDRDGALRPDQLQDYILKSASVEFGYVILEFDRAIDTCDFNDYQLDNGTSHVIFVESLNSTESPFGHDVTKLRHGVQRVQILKPDIPKPVFPADMWTFEVRAPEILVPAEETTYWWQTVTLPDIQTPHHIIQYEGIISEGSHGLVHHMEVFHCQVKNSDSVPFYSGPGLSEGKPKGLEVCRKVIGAWAMGAEAMVYPESAGVPVGGPGYSRLALLEVHYNNPLKESDHMDTSGIRFYVTSHVRKYDAAIMELGLEYTNKMAVPPRQQRFALSGYCVQDCTQVGISSLGIHVFASQLHTHLTGKRVYTKHVRAGRELPEVNRDSHYSPHFQEIRRLPQPVHVLPGDDLITTCEYDTTDRAEATVGGFAISDEMCVNYIHYYPKTELEVCKSSIQTQALDNFMYLINKLENANVYPGAGDRANYKNINWLPVNINLLRNLYATSPLSMQCNKSDGTRFPGDWEHTQVPEITEPFVIQKSGTVC